MTVKVMSKIVEVTPEIGEGQRFIYVSKTLIGCPPDADINERSIHRAGEAGPLIIFHPTGGHRPWNDTMERCVRACLAILRESGLE